MAENRDIYDPYLLRTIRLLKRAVEEQGGQLSGWRRLDYMERDGRYYTLAFDYISSRLNPKDASHWVLYANSTTVYLDSKEGSEFGAWRPGISLIDEWRKELLPPENIIHSLFQILTGDELKWDTLIPSPMPLQQNDIHLIQFDSDGLSFTVLNGSINHTFSRNDYSFSTGCFSFGLAEINYYPVTAVLLENGEYIGEQMVAVSASQEMIILQKELQKLIEIPPSQSLQIHTIGEDSNNYDQLIEQAREVEIISFVEKNGWLAQSKKIVNSDRYVRADGFAGTNAKITFYRDTNSFVWWNNNNLGGDVIAFAQSWLNCSFRKAIEFLTGETYQKINRNQFRQTPVPKKDLVLPQKAEGQKQLFGYLCKARGIASAVVQKAIKDGLLYQGEEVYQKGERPWREAVAVFTGLKEDGSVGYASMRSLHDQDDYHYFVVKRDCTGSEKQHGWVFGGTPDSSWVIVCEAPIDALSIATMMYERDPVHYFAPYILSLGGCADVALEYFLAGHPKVTQIEVCTDHDAAGLKAAHYIQSKYQENAGVPSWTDEEGRLQPGFADPYQRQFSVYLNVPKELGRDWNEILKQQKGIPEKIGLEQSSKVKKGPER